MPGTNQDFVDTLIAWRTQRGLSMAAAARQLKIPYRTLQDWEAGLHAPRGFARRMILETLARRGRRRR